MRGYRVVLLLCAFALAGAVRPGWAKNSAEFWLTCLIVAAVVDFLELLSSPQGAK